MRFEKSLFLIVVGVAALAGCSRQEPKVVVSGTPSAETGDASSPERTPTPGPTSPKESPGAERPEPAKTMGSEPIPKTGERNWQRTTAKAIDLARKVDTAVKGLRGTYGESFMNIRTPEGPAQARLIYKVQDSKLFRLEYLEPTDVPSIGYVIADGKTKRTVSSGSGKAFSQPISQPSALAKLDASEIATRFPKEFSRLMFLGLTDGTGAWERAVLGLARGEGGFELRVEQRQREFRGKKLINYRLVATRKPELARRQGPCELEIVIDGERYLPVTVRMISKDAKGKPWEMQWSAGWNFGQKFSNKDIVSPS